jgi:putative peptidoglycan lipid II flippase
MSLARDVTSVGAATVASRVLAFLRDMWIASVLGTGVAADAFFAVLQLINVFRHMLAEGALNAAFIPMWLRVKNQNGEAGAVRFARDVLLATFLMAGLVASTGFLFASPVIGILMPGFDAARHDAAANYLRGAAPYFALAGSGAVFVAWLCAEGRVGAASIGIVAFNVVLLLVLALATTHGMPSQDATGTLMAQAIALAGLAQVLITGAAVWRLRNWRFSWRRGHNGASDDAILRDARLASTRAQAICSQTIWRFFALAGPSLLAAGMLQLTLTAGAMIASSSAASVAWLYYTNRLYELPLAVIAVITATVMAPRIAVSLRATDRTIIAGAQSLALEIALGLSLPAALALALLADDIAGGLFERGAFRASDTSAVAAALAAICIGLPGHALEKVFGTLSLAHDDAMTPMLAALAGLATAVIAAMALFPEYGHVGVAAAIGASGWVSAALLGSAILRRGWLHVGPRFVTRLLRIVAATGMMGAALIALQALVAPRIDHANAPSAQLDVLAALAGAALIVYAASLELFGVVRFRDLAAELRGRR